MAAIKCYSTTLNLLAKRNIVNRGSSSLGLKPRFQSLFQPKCLKLVDASGNNVKSLHCLSRSCLSSISSTAIKPANHHDRERDGSVTVEIQPEKELKKMVHVKFVMKKACLFGEQIMLVGDDPSLGGWDPKNAVPLQWSDGHLWTTHMDVPVGKSIQYKFLLKGISGEVNWQAGSDRFVRIWDASKTVVVYEEWGNENSQRLTEEEEEEEEGEEEEEEEVNSSVMVKGVVEKTADEKKKTESMGKNKNAVTKEKEGLLTKPKRDSVFKPAVIESNMECLLSNDVPVKCNLS